jgi:hypothetical protein
MDGGRTVNVFEEKSPPGLPVAVIVYTPAGTLATTKELRGVGGIMPPIIVQVGAATGIPDNVQLVSLGEKFEPDTETLDPTWPEVGFRLSGFSVMLNNRSPSLFVRIALLG